MRRMTGPSATIAIAGIALFMLFGYARSANTVPGASEGVPASASGTPILLFAGKGASAGDVRAIKALLERNHLAYAAVDSVQLNAMTQSQIASYRLFLMPGGDFPAMGLSLTDQTTARVRSAVSGGVNYVGICAGGFLAGSFPSPYRSFNFTSGVKFEFYSAASKGITKATVKIATVDGQALEHYWESGPQFTGWGEIIGTYPDGTPAIVQGKYGKGRVILSGVHPEAPESWRTGMTFQTQASESNAYALRLIDAALGGQNLARTRGAIN